MSILIVDTGTTSMRGVLFDETMAQIGLARVNYQQTFSPDGAVTQPAESFSNALQRICSELQTNAPVQWKKLTAMALTAQRSSVIPLDANGRPLAAAMMWQDKRAVGLNEAIYARYADRLTALAGTRITPVFSAPKMRWFKEYAPEIYASAEKLVSIQDYLIHTLTGDYTTDPTFACRSGLMDIHTCRWSSELLAAYEIDAAKLCRIIPAGSVSGSITPAATAFYGLPESVRVVTAGGDQQCAILGMGACRPGDLVINIGTGAYAALVTDTPVIRMDGSTALSIAASRGLYIVEASIPVAGPRIDAFCKETYGSEDRAYWYQRFNDDAACLLHGFPPDHAAAVLAKTLADECAELLRTLAALHPNNGDILIGGGLSASAPFCQALSNASGRIIRRSPATEATVQGALYQLTYACAGADAQLQQIDANQHNYAQNTRFIPQGERNNQ